MKTSITELPESRVKIDVAVAADDLAKRVDRAARSLAGEMKMPGFRKGKVPAQLVIQRVGREAVVEQALREALPEWYERALLDSGVTAIGEPKLDVGELPGEGEDLDFSIEVGVRLDAELSGAAAGDERSVEVSFPDDHEPADLAGKTAIFEVKVKEVREKNLPELDDEFASEASEFETLAELRDEIRGRMAEGLEQRAEAEFREAAVDAVAARAKLDIPHDLVHARAHEMWERIERQLTSRGIDPQTYARMQGKDRHDLINDAEEDSERALRREAVLDAVADAEGIDPGDEQLIEALGPGEGKNDPAKLLARLRETGRDSLLRDEVRLRMAADVLAESVEPIPMERAAAREQIWTPEKAAAEAESAAGTGSSPGTGSPEREPGGKPGELWTPGS